MSFQPSHVVPTGGLPAWSDPDPSNPPAANLATGTEFQVVERLGAWARVVASNGWTGWVDGTRLIERGAPASPPVPTTAPAHPVGGPVGTRFCRNCGQTISAQAAICPHCGVAAAGPPGWANPRRKDKTVAILLAVFLGFWTWLYTYDRDSQKFWIGLGVSIAGVILTFIIIGILPLLGIYIWAIVDVATKPSSYYENFPHG